MSWSFDWISFLLGFIVGVTVTCDYLEWRDKRMHWERKGEKVK